MNANKQVASVSLLLACFWAIPVFSADSKAGEEKAAICAGCHGQGGKSSNPQWPSLAAQQQTYIVNQLAAFKSGTRKNSVMQGMAASLSDGDMKNIAAYFNGQSAAKAAPPRLLGCILEQALPRPHATEDHRLHREFEPLADEPDARKARSLERPRFRMIGAKVSAARVLAGERGSRDRAADRHQAFQIDPVMPGQIESAIGVA